MANHCSQTTTMLCIPNLDKAFTCTNRNMGPLVKTLKVSLQWTNRAHMETSYPLYPAHAGHRILLELA